MSHETVLRRDDAVLVLIDVQEKLLPAIANRDEVVRNCRILLEGARILGIPIIVTEQYTKGLGPTVADLVAAAGDAPRFEKMTFSCAGCDLFAEKLEDIDREQVLLCGIEAHVCVVQTALDLLADGWQIQVPADAVGSRRAENRQIAIDRMRQSGVVITATESALFEMLVAAGTDAFKSIVRLVR